MRRMRSMLALTAALAVAGAMVLVNGVSAASATQVDGVMRVVELGDPTDITDDVTQVWGDLIGYWWTTSFEVGVVTKSGVVHGRGTERFDGCRDVNGNGRCDAGDPAGSLYLTFTYSGKFDPRRSLCCTGDATTRSQAGRTVSSGWAASSRCGTTRRPDARTTEGT